MLLRTTARDCLYLNWAVPVDAAPELPLALRYEIHRWQERDWIFVSALLFWLSGLHLPAVPFPRLSYPQMNLRLDVADRRNVPSVLFRRMLVPWWVAPVSRWLAQQPASVAGFRFPASGPADRETWSWTVQCRDPEGRRRLEVEGRLGAPEIGDGPRFGSWERTVEYFRNRPHGYALFEKRLRSIRTFHPDVQALPLRVEIGASELLDGCFPGVGEGLWQRPHSAWLCPRIPFDFELGKLVVVAPSQARAGVPAAEGC